MSLFKKPDDTDTVTFMIRGLPGTGKTRFSLAAKGAIHKQVAYLGNDRGAKFYRDDPTLGGFLQIETSDIKLIRQAVEELKQDNGKTFGAVVIDTVSGIWSSEQAEFEKTDAKGQTFIPLRAWRPLRDGHEKLLRDLQKLPCHVFLICEEKPIFQRLGSGDNVELVEVGSKEDSDKKDSYVSDVRLRMFVEGKQFFCEVLKDRTGKFKMGEIIENPHPSMWIKSAPKPVALPPEDAKPTNGHTEQAADESEPDSRELEFQLMTSNFVKRIERIKNQFEMDAWSKKHKAELDSLPEHHKKLLRHVAKLQMTKFKTGPKAATGEG